MDSYEFTGYQEGFAIFTESQLKQKAANHECVRVTCDILIRRLEEIKNLPSVSYELVEKISQFDDQLRMSLYPT